MSERRLSRYVQPLLPEGRIARQWTEVARRSARGETGRRSLSILAVGGAVVACVAAFVLARPHPQASLEGAILKGGDVVLPDGSQIAVDDGGQVRIDAVSGDRVELALVAGSLRLTVPHASRRVVVHAGAFDVVDLGTRFRVQLGASGEVGVEVAEGSVQVERRGGGRPGLRVDAGEHWSNASPSTAPPAAPKEEPSAPPPAASSPAPTDDAVPSAALESTAGPKDLLESAERARIAGNPQGAATAFDTLRRRYRRDPRAALAAFELGRLRLDSLDDPAGAVEALNDAIALAPRGPLREDAEARRVEALAAARSPECASARDAFLARYPRGVHRALVARQCAAN
ncbi:MAG TPA: FecR family protein [Polyangiaceae bacterium]|nr:FecR family protein [Polyangiaceae bacterium]